VQGTSPGDQQPSSRALAEALRDPERELLGTVLSTVDPVFGEVASFHVDLVWIDLEHSPISVRDAQVLVIAAAAAGAFSLIRVRGTDGDGLGALLDTGVNGIVVPRVETAADLEALSLQTLFPPRGRRGYAPRRVTLNTTASFDERPACIVQVESRAAVDRAAELAACDITDALVVGTSDLSLDLGTPMRTDSPELIASVEQVRAAALAAGKGWGVAAGGDPARLRALAGERGATLVYASDVRVFTEAIADAARRLRGRAE
jgi:4-hydroxy-2-oxoheptanedioate aldolase